MSRNELVSIIIPNYNHARYLGEAIESVIAQTYAPHRSSCLMMGLPTTVAK